jgi:predicted acylesterase/phospholipase RssA
MTYPDMKLVTAIRATCAIPPIIRPVVVGDQYMIDGGFVANIPVNAGIDYVRRYLDDTVDINSFFAIRSTEPTQNSIPPTSNMFQFMIGVIRKMGRTIKQDSSQQSIPNTVWIDTKSIPALGLVEEWKSSMDCSKKRRSLVQIGKKLYERWHRLSES